MATTALSADLSAIARSAAAEARSAKEDLFATYARIAPRAASRVNDLIESLHADIPNPSRYELEVIRDYAIALWRNEISLEFEASFFDAAIAAEREDPETKAMIEVLGDAIVPGRALMRDSNGPKTLAKLMRYQSRITKELAAAAHAYDELYAAREEDSHEPENAGEKTNPIAPESTQTPRNAQCPCGSGLKFKRCCGEHAPAVLNTPNFADLLSGFQR